MKIISEYTLTSEQIKTYRDKGYEVYYGYEKPYVKQGESVGLLLDTMYKSSIDLIGSLLYRKIKSKITIKYKGEVYHISTPDEWQHKYYENHRWHTVNHPILNEYYLKRTEYFEQKNLDKAKEQTKTVLEYFHSEIPEDLDLILNNFARLYDVDYTDNLKDKLNAYANIKYYLDNGFEYVRDIVNTLPNEEPMFDVISFGNECYLEDYIYKNAE